MVALHLKEAFTRLSQHSVNSVQSGKEFTEWDEYMHVDRPIETKLIEKMDQIDEVGGGIIFLVGSAGDGKSHLISRIKQMSDWDDNSFYNDATASCSPKKTAIDTLKEALVEYKDSNLYSTSKKLVLAINLGKLNALIEDNEFKDEYKELVHSTRPIFDDNDTAQPFETRRVKVLLFTNEQIFEFDSDSTKALPVDSSFLYALIGKIVEKSDLNPFYKAYKKDLAEEVGLKDPLILNFQLLSLPEVRHSIVMTVIEAIVCYKLIITPREFLDFLYSILVCPNYDSYKEKTNFYDALLPTLFYTGKENVIQKAISKMDPLKHSSTDHDSQLSVLFTSYSIPKNYFTSHLLKNLPQEMLKRINDFYANNGRDIERTTKFIFRLKHLLCYHSENEVYMSFMNLLKGIFKKDVHSMKAIYDLVSKTIPRHYGSYYEKKDMIPLNIQGGKYRLFASLSLKPQIINPFYSSLNHFLLSFDMSWMFPSGDISHPLHMDYQLYSYLYELNRGKLALSYENEKNLIFSRFVRKLIEKCDCEHEIVVVKYDTKELQLCESTFGNIELQ